MGKNKKILICEDHEMLAKSLKRSFEREGYESVILAYQDNPNRVVEELEGILETQKPDYIIIDGLRGRCFDAAELAKKAKLDLKVIIHSAEEHIIDEAKSKGYEAFIKITEYDEMMDFIKRD